MSFYTTTYNLQLAPVVLACSADNINNSVFYSTFLFTTRCYVRVSAMEFSTSVLSQLLLLDHWLLHPWMHKVRRCFAGSVTYTYSAPHLGYFPGISLSCISSLHANSLSPGCGHYRHRIKLSFSKFAYMMHLVTRTTVSFLQPDSSFKGCLSLLFGWPPSILNNHPLLLLAI